MAGLSSLSKNINIKGQPHSLAYINKAEAALLKARGGSGKPMKGTRGVPAYIDMGEGMGGYGSGAADDATGGAGDPGAGMGGAETDAAGTYGGAAAAAAAEAAAWAAFAGFRSPAEKQAEIDSLEALEAGYMSRDRPNLNRPGRTLNFNKFRTRAVGPQFYEFKQGLYPHSWQNTTVDTLEMGVPQQSAMLDDLMTKAGWDEEDPDSAISQLGKFGPPPSNVVTNRYGHPIAFKYGWLTQRELEEEEEFAPLGKLRKKRILPKIPYERQRKIDALDFRLQMQSPEERTSELMRDPSLMWSSTDYGLRTQYQDSIRNAAKYMTENEVLGVMGPDGNRVGGFINTLEDGGFFNTHGLGIRGPDEITSPEGMNEEQHNRYKNLFMADDGTEGNALRMALDAAKGLTTVGDVFGDLGVDAKDYGLNAMMGAERVSDYLDMTAFEGWIKGFPTFLSVLTGPSPFIIPGTFGAGEIFKEFAEDLADKLPEALQPTRKAVETAAQEIGDVIPDKEKVTERLGTLFGVKTPEYFAKEGFYNKVEPTIDSLLPDDVRAADAVERGPVASDIVGPSEKDSVARAVERREPALLRPGQPETYIAAANERNAGRIDEDLVGDQPPFRPAGPGEVQPETIDSMRSNMYDNLPLPAGPAVPVTPVERQVLSPGSVMSAYEASLEPPAVQEDVRRDVVTRQLSPDQTLTDEQTAEIMAMIDNPSIASPDTLTATDKEIEQPVLEDISQLPPDVTSSEDKTLIENYVKNNVKKGFMTLEEGNAILEADTSKKLEKAVAKFIARSKKEMASQARQTNRRSKEQNNRLSKQAQKEKAKRAGVN